MKRRYYVLIGFIIALVQAYLGRLFEINGVLPDLVLIYLVCISLFEGHKTGVYTALVTGIMYDIFFADYIGYYSIFYVILSYLLGYYRQNFFYSNIQISVIFTIVGTIGKYLFMKVFQIFVSVNFNMLNLKVIFYTIIYNIAFCVIFHIGILKIRAWSSNERE